MTELTAKFEDIPETEEESSESPVRRRIADGKSLGDQFADDKNNYPDDAEWMMTYMDTITLIVTLFVVLISMSQIQEPLLAHDAQEVKENEIIDVAPTPMDLSSNSSEALDMITKGIAEQDLPDLVNVSVVDNQINLEINDSVLFESGRADLSSAGHALIGKLMSILTNGEYGISVEGHTDNVPISTNRFPSNWDLSSGRASTVVRALISVGIKPTRLEATGHADTRPIVDNATPENRARNRRVNLVLEIQGN